MCKVCDFEGLSDFDSDLSYRNCVLQVNTSKFAMPPDLLCFVSNCLEWYIKV